MLDATDKTLGRLATEVARRLRGKHKPEFTPHVDTGDYIVIVNAERCASTGRKSTDKIYYRHSGYPGGLTETSFTKLIQTQPHKVIEIAVKGMLPKGPMDARCSRKLKVYAGPKHEHSAQQPKTWKCSHDTDNYATGRRKTSSARVYMQKGTGKITVNGRDLDVYFGRQTARMIVRQPLQTVNMLGDFDTSTPM